MNEGTCTYSLLNLKGTDSPFFIYNETLHDKPKVKICCISIVEKANMAIRYGADALGLVGNIPSGPGIIDDRLIKQIVKTIP